MQSALKGAGRHSGGDQVGHQWSTCQRGQSRTIKDLRKSDNEFAQFVNEYLFIIIFFLVFSYIFVLVYFNVPMMTNKTRCFRRGIIGKQQVPAEKEN